MQFREHKNIVPICLWDKDPQKLTAKVAILSKNFPLIDLQYSSHCKGDEPCFSVFVLVQLTDKQMKMSDSELLTEFNK